MSEPVNGDPQKDAQMKAALVEVDKVFSDDMLRNADLATIKNVIAIMGARYNSAILFAITRLQQSIGGHIGNS